MFINGKGIKYLQCQFKSQKNTWMDSAIFEQCVQDFHIIIENCPTHSRMENLKAVNLVFLPPSTTPKTRQMAHRVKQALKTQWLLNTNSDSLM